MRQGKRGNNDRRAARERWAQHGEPAQRHPNAAVLAQWAPPAQAAGLNSTFSTHAAGSGTAAGIACGSAATT